MRFNSGFKGLKDCLSLLFHKKVTCLIVCRLRVGQLLCVFCKIVYLWAKTNCSFMSDVSCAVRVGAEEVAFDVNMILDQRSTEISLFPRHQFKIDCKSTPKTQRNLNASCAKVKETCRTVAFSKFWFKLFTN